MGSLFDQNGRGSSPVTGAWQGYLTAGASGLVTSAAHTGDASQRRLLNSNGQIVSEASGKCLDVSGQATAAR